MRTGKKRIRVDYAPLTASVSLTCATAGSPLAQVYDSSTGTYEPNRELTPTLITPVVTLNANDGSLQSPYGNPMLAGMKWYVDNVDISTMTEWQGKYEILTEGSVRGSIRISRNVEPGTVLSLRFEGKIADTRLGVTIPIETDEAVLSTTDKTADQYALSLEDDTTIAYNPFLDRLAEYDYKVAHGIISASSSARNAAKDQNAYERRIPFTLYAGFEPYTGDCTARLYRVVSSTSLTELAVGTDKEAVAIESDGVTLDLRLVHDGEYMVKVFIGDIPVAQAQFSISRMYPEYTIRSTNGTAIAPADKRRYDKAMVDSKGRIVECPEVALKMKWYTTTAHKEDVEHNEGAETLFMLSSTGIGETYSDDWLDIDIVSEFKPAHCVATDSGGNIYVDKDGNTLIFN